MNEGAFAFKDKDNLEQKAYNLFFKEKDLSSELLFKQTIEK